MSPVRCLRADLPPPGRFVVSEVTWAAKLDQNEAPVDLPAELKKEIAAELAAAAWNRYPQPGDYREAKARLARAIGVEAEQVALTVGGDQAIQAAFLLAGGAGRRAMWFEPTYPYVALAARVTGTGGGPVVLGPEVERSIDGGAIDGDLVVLVSPNNPTGGLCARGVVDAALANERRLVLVDEAYADFAGETLIGEARALPNLMIARSLSKSLLAGVRLGFAVAHPEVVAAIEKIYTAPYHLNAWQLRVAARYGEIAPYVRAAVEGVKLERERVYEALRGVAGVTPRPSRANFIFFAVDGKAAALHAKLAAAGVRVRDVSSLPGAGEALRVTIGTREENDLFLRELRAS